MADVVLKNKSGTPVTYAGVTAVQLKTLDGGVQLFSEGGESGGGEWVFESNAINAPGNGILAVSTFDLSAVAFTSSAEMGEE